MLSHTPACYVCDQQHYSQLSAIPDCICELILFVMLAVSGRITTSPLLGCLQAPARSRSNVHDLHMLVATCSANDAVAEVAGTVRENIKLRRGFRFAL